MHEAKSIDAVSLSSIQHSEVEEKIFTTLKDVLNKYDLDTQLRVAGGWVRDKVWSSPFAQSDPMKNASS
jgi:hypothetical protein